MKLENITVKVVVVEARAGALIYDCYREALLLAVTEDREVEFKHNDKNHRVNWRKLIATKESL